MRTNNVMVYRPQWNFKSAVNQAWNYTTSAFIRAGQAIKLSANAIWTAIKSVARRVMNAVGNGARLIAGTYNRVKGWIVERVADNRQTRMFKKAARQYNSFKKANAKSNFFSARTKSSVTGDANQWRESADAYANQKASSAGDWVMRKAAQVYDAYRRTTRKAAEHFSYTRNYRPSRSHAINADRAKKMNTSVERMDKAIRAGVTLAGYGVASLGVNHIVNSNSKEDK